LVARRPGAQARRHRHPPAAARLLGFLRKVWARAERTRWVHLDLGKFATFSGLSIRQVQRAKNHLQSTHAVEFVTLSNRSGRGHRVFAANPQALDGTSKTLMAWTADGKERHRWTKIRGEMLALPSRKPTEIPPSSSPRPTDILGGHHTRGKSLQHSKHSLWQVSGRGSSQPEGDFSASRWKWTATAPPTASQRALAWFTVRRISELWWDNCKVQHPGARLGGVFNLALRWIRRGANISDIIKKFRESLEKMHGLCVDFQLLRLDSSLRFTIGSTITRADRELCRLFSAGKLMHWTSCVVVQA